MVNPQVRHEVDAEHLEERARERPVDKCTEPDGDTEVGYEDLPFLMRFEQRCAWNEVYGTTSVMYLTSALVIERTIRVRGV